MTEIYHFIGIGGIGMSALARILLQQGKTVQGSDNASSKITKGLEKLGAKIFEKQCFSQVRPGCHVVYSTDIKEDNPEYLAAKSLGLPLLHRSELLAQLMKDTKPLLVTGTHGKTTTSSLLAHVLKSIGWDPSYAIGGVIKGFSTNSGAGTGPYFVAEADESDGSFLAYSGFGAIITNIDLDHLNHWMTEEALIEGFKKFADNVLSKEHLLFCKDDERLSRLSLQGISYGFSSDADAHLTEFMQDGFNTRFSFCFRGKEYKDVQLPLIGKHNALNACAVFVLSLQLGASEQEVRVAFSSFQGVGRRADKIGEARQISFYDDYGHHPTEILATLTAFKQSHPENRLVTVFQPHRYTRTRDCMEEFASALSSSDIVVLTDIYAAGESPLEGIDTQAVFARVSDVKKEGVYYLRKDALVEFLSGFLQEKDVVVTMGAGDITKYGPYVIERMGL
ncbi:MAG: UDP-N-acetylmuramate--L-alanine ligase [Chlamydiae bacterium]|nr:UDP-N-acetylmuramate--L-alanine ligase [Chlamydiota bacterium]